MTIVRFTAIFLPTVLLILFTALRYMRKARAAAAAAREADRRRCEAIRRASMRAATVTFVPSESPDSCDAPVKRGRPRKEEAPLQADPSDAPETLPLGNGAFDGQSVCFTGRLPGMSRREAMAIVAADGGRSFEAVSSSVTMLVVGERAGKGKLEAAENRTDVRRIDADEFFRMIRQPLPERLSVLRENGPAPHSSAPEHVSVLRCV